MLTQALGLFRRTTSFRSERQWPLGSHGGHARRRFPLRGFYGAGLRPRMRNATNIKDKNFPNSSWKECVRSERRSRRLSRDQRARGRSKSRRPATARTGRPHGRCAGRPLHSSPHAPSRRYGRSNARGKRRTIRWLSRLGNLVLRAQAQSSRNGRGWSLRPCSTLRRTALQWPMERSRQLRKQPSKPRRTYDGSSIRPVRTLSRDRQCGNHLKSPTKGTSWRVAR